MDLFDRFADRNLEKIAVSDEWISNMLESTRARIADKNTSVSVKKNLKGRLARLEQQAATRQGLHEQAATALGKTQGGKLTISKGNAGTDQITNMLGSRSTSTRALGMRAQQAVGKATDRAVGNSGFFRRMGYKIFGEPQPGARLTMGHEAAQASIQEGHANVFANVGKGKPGVAPTTPVTAPTAPTPGGKPGVTAGKGFANMGALKGLWKRTPTLGKAGIIGGGVLAAAGIGKMMFGGNN